MRARVPALGAALIVAGGLVTACGGGDSTVSGTPDTETLAPPPGGAASSSARVPVDEDSGRFTEAPGTVSSDTPGYDAPAVGARERGYLEVLEREGVQTEELQDPLVAAGNTICRIRTTGGAADETTTIADAVAGQIVAGGYSDLEVEQVARIVVDASAGQLCP
ncbi:hypothetical protein NCCP2495_16370 [Dietzia sp. NCCP-2495]|uniref:DUF732 domain-containing protein n=1 Tax=Dietzia sp. NCCP-2495 TaxID=2934675 RepID=UPI002230F94E|nr:DUF732 domain-containing protein [Dietzia sp. NCCP-2495]GLB63758.1 hypothetical protein NCCP2495_16370 [Dietzia sp. NCCP-2495]